jgi:hypothetical protein
LYATLTQAMHNRYVTKSQDTTKNEIPMAQEWSQEDKQLLNELLDELITRLTLARPDYAGRFNL